MGIKGCGDIRVSTYGVFKAYGSLEDPIVFPEDL